ELLDLNAPTSSGIHLRIIRFSPDGSRIAVLVLTKGLDVWEAPRDLEEHQRVKQERFRVGLTNWHRDQAAEFERAGHWFGAAFHLQRLCGIDPADPGYFYRHAIALFRLGKVEEARKRLDKAVQLAEKNPRADKALQLQLQDLRKQAEALLKEPPPEP